MGVFDRFLNTTDEAAGVQIVNAANPVNWGGLAKAIFSAITAAVAVGVTNIFGSIADGAQMLYGGLREFLTGRVIELPAGLGGDLEVDGLIDVTIGRFPAVVGGFWEFNVEQFGIFAGPVTIAITLAALYIIVRGGRRALAEFTGDA